MAQENALAAQAVEGKTEPEQQQPAQAASLFPDEDAQLAQIEKQIAESAAKAASPAPATPADDTAKESVQETPPAASPDANAKPVRPYDPQKAAIVAMRRSLQESEKARIVAETEARMLREQLGTGAAGSPPADQDGAVALPQTKEEINEAIIANQQDYDDGKITPADFKRIELGLLDQRMRITIAESLPPETISLEESDHLDKLVNDYPMLNFLTREQLDPFYEQAVAHATATGRPYANNARGNIQLREDMAKLATAHYMGIINSRAQANAGTAAQPASSGKPPALSETAAAREAKLNLAGNHPPNIGNLGAGVSGTGPTEEDMLRQLASLGGDEDAQLKLISANPAFFNKVLNGVLH